QRANTFKAFISVKTGS
ncbi:short chain dehydrogenase family protein, partial [Vibrio parahaemolyticus V-223/04]